MNSIKNLGSYFLKHLEIFQKQCKLYLNDLLLNIEIISKFSLLNQNDIFQFVVEHLNSCNIINLIDCESLLSILGYYNEYYPNYYCCDEHQNFLLKKRKKE